MSRKTWFQLLIVMTTLLSGAVYQTARAETFSFVALGDTAYNLPNDLPTYDALITTINKAKPAFSIHVGDTWGANVCNDDEQKNVLAVFGKYEQPIVYTPGDNEWVDCRKPEVLAAYLRFVSHKPTPEDMVMLGKARSFDDSFALGSYDDGLHRLAAIRRIFFATAQSLGKHSMAVTRQSDVSEFKDMVENARWEHDGVIFGTINMPGSNNDFFVNSEARALDAIRRTKADVAWLKALFTEAKASNAKAVVIGMQASMFDEGEGNEDFGRPIRGGQNGPFWWIASAIRDFGSAFGKPVLLINGDDHAFIVDKPFRVGSSETEAPKHDNITRLQVFGAPDLRAVRVTVDTDTPWVFGFAPLY